MQRAYYRTDMPASAELSPLDGHIVRGRFSVTRARFGCSEGGGPWRLALREADMAIIARFSFDVPFGKKDELFRLEAKFRELQRKLGFPEQQTLVGSIGTPESRVENNYRFENLAALEAVFAKVAQEPRMAEFQREMGAFIVPGSHRWEILRVRE
jgi:hypothetical protein